MEKQLIINLDCTQLPIFKMLVGQLIKTGNREVIPLFNCLCSSYELMENSDIFEDTKYLDLWLFNLDVVRKFFFDLHFDVCPIILEDFCKELIN